MRDMIKTIKITDEELHRELINQKYDHGDQSIQDTIRRLLIAYKRKR
jgi:predicted CopG family antitoxin